MGKLLEKYSGFVADEVLSLISELAPKLSGRSVLHVYSGRLRPGAIAGIRQLGAHCEELGIQHRETKIVGTEDLFDVGRLAEDQSTPGILAYAWTARYEEVMRENARKTFLSSDLVMVHGLQPLGLVEDRRHECPWLWRCYANLVGNLPVQSFVRPYLSRYQGAIFSAKSFIPAATPASFVIPPSVDPFSPVNESPGNAGVARILEDLGIPTDRPLALQFLGAEGVSDALQAIRVWKSGLIPPNAVLALVQIREAEKAGDSDLDAVLGLDPNVRVLRLARGSSRELCALGWAARVVIDFTSSRWPNQDVLDVMWKGKPALVSCESGTAPFVRNGCGYGVRTSAELARKLGELLEDHGAAREMGACAHLSVGRHHLVPRHLLDTLKLLRHYTGNESPADFLNADQ